MSIFALAIEAVVVVAIILNIAITFLNAVVRDVFQQDFSWATDAWTILIALITFLGAPVYFRRTSGMAYTALIDRVEGDQRQILEAIGLAVFLGICVAALVAFPQFFASQSSQTLPVLDISTGFVAVWLGVGFVLMSSFTIEKLTLLRRRAVAIGIAVTLVMGLAMALLRWGYESGAITIDPFILVMPPVVVAFLAGTPIAGILALIGMLFFLVTGTVPMVTIPAAMQYGVSSFVMLAVPFFMVAGTLMDVTGMARRMIGMVQNWVGHWSGGLLVAEVVAMYIFSGLSGSKVADMATVGSVMKVPLRQYGYPATESVAVLSASAAMGETIPPSLMLLLLGSITTLSVGSLFVAGVMPAVTLSIALIVAAIIRSRIHHFPKGAPFSLRRALRSTPPALPACLVPVIVVGGIIGGIASPTESATFAVVYGFAAALVVYHDISLRLAWDALRDA